MVKKIVILDENLINYNGHNADYFFAIAKELEKRKIDYYILGNIKAIDFNNEHILKTFRLSTISSKKLNIFEKLTTVITSNYYFFLDCKKFKSKIKESKILILNNLSIFNYFGIIGLLLNLKIPILIILHDFPLKKAYFQYVLLKKIFPKLVRFRTQSELITKNIQKKYQITIPSLPTPQIFLEKNNKRVGKLKPTISFLGIASKAKGINFIFKSLLLPNYSNRIVELLKKIELNIQIGNYQNVDLEIIKSKYPSINFIKSDLNTENFKKIFLDTDFLLCPYNPLFYHYIQSGLCTQALCSDIAIIHSKGLGMSSEIKDHGTSYEFIFDDTEDFIKCMERAVDDYNNKNLKKSFTSLYAEKHGPSMFVDQVLSLI